MKTYQNILSIESSCDETAVAVITNGQIKSSIIASQATLHAQYGGVVPEVAAREHVTAIIPTIDLALRQAQINLREVNCIAVTQGPGLMTSLLVGIETAQTIGRTLDIPVLPINHLAAHIYANFIKQAPNTNLQSHSLESSLPPLPALVLIVSGGHTLLVLMKAHGNFEVLGETVDDAAGEAFDKTAKILGLDYPGGPLLSRLAESGNPKAFDFPRPMVNSPDLNFSFSGLKTAVLYQAQKYPALDSKLKADFAASIQQAIIDVLISKTEKAISQCQPQSLLLGGGVAVNKLLRENFNRLAVRFQIPVFIPQPQYCTDNAAMIGLAAYYQLQSSGITIPTQFFKADPNLELA